MKKPATTKGRTTSGKATIITLKKVIHLGKEEISSKTELDIKFMNLTISSKYSIIRVKATDKESPT
ncbi:MAG: hypothetical protein RR315_00425 [Oscillospiraceae bacterium]